MKKYLPFFLICFFATPLHLHSQGQWTRIFGGDQGNTFSGICRATDGGIFAAGITSSFGPLYPLLNNDNSNIFIVKTDSMGNLQWQKAIGDSLKFKEITAVVQTPDSDLFLVGYNQNGNFQNTIIVVKLDSLGTFIWKQTLGVGLFGRPGRLVSEGNNIVATGYFENGANGDDVFITKIDNNGNIVWYNTFAIPDHQSAYGICRVHDGGYLLAGQWRTGNIKSAYVIRTNDTGDSLWTKVVTQMYSSTSIDVGFRGCTELNGDTVFALTGNTHDNGLWSKMAAVKINLNGEVTSFYRSTNYADFGSDVKPLDNGGFIVAGNYSNYGFSAMLSAFSPTGNLIWQKLNYHMGGRSNYQYCIVNALLPSTDGGFIMAGNTMIFGAGSRKGILVKTNHLGEVWKEPAITPTVTGNASFCSGGTAVVSVPDDYDHYQWFWYKSNQQVSLITNSDTSAITVDSSYYYRCAMWNNNGSIVISEPCTVMVAGLPDTTINVIGGYLNVCPPLETKLQATQNIGTNFQWLYNGTTMAGNTNYIITPQIEGYYSVQITNPCTTITTSPVYVTIGSPPSLDLEPDTIHLSYYNGANTSCTNVLLSVILYGGATCEWYRNGIPTGITTSFIYVNTSGYYYLRVQNNCGIGWSDTAWATYDTIFTPVVQQIPSSGPIPPLTGCANSSARIRVASNFTNVSYQWYKDGNPIGSAQSNSYAPGNYSSGADTGYYYCIITSLCSGNQIHKTDSIYYAEELSSRNVGFQGGYISCSGSPITLNAQQTNASYQWYIDTIPIPGAVSQSFVVTTTGIYLCEITRPCGSYFTDQRMFIIGTPPALIQSSYQGICRTDTDTARVRLSSAVPIINGVYYNSFRWRFNGVIIPNATQHYYETKIPGIYDCLFIYNCDSVISNQIILPDYYIPPHISSDNYGRFCPGETINLHATPGYFYQWYQRTGFTDVLIPGATDSIYSTNTAAQFVVNISNGLCNIMSNTFEVIAQSPPFPNQILNTTPTQYCDTTSVELFANYRNDLSYQWYFNGVAIPGATLPVYYASVSGDFVVSLTDTFGCSSVSPAMEINNQVLGSVFISNGGGVNICQGSTVTLATGLGYNSYQWFHDGLPVGGANGNTFQTGLPGLYTVEVSDGGSCLGSASVVAQVVAPPTLTLGSLVPASCQSSTGSMTLFFTPPADVTVSSPSYFIQESNAFLLSQPSLSQGWYYITYSNHGGGCTLTDSVEILSQPNLYVNINAGTGAVCLGNYITASYTGPANLLWSNGQGNNCCLWPDTTGWYAVTATNSTLGCSGTDSAFITVNPLPTVNIQTSGPTVLCSGETVTLDVGSGFSQVLWSTGMTSASITVGVSGIYIVTVTDSVTGCTNKDTVIVTSSVTPVVSITSASGGVICQGDSIQLEVTSGYPFYIWSTGDTTNIITVNAAGWYAVTVTDTSGNCNTIDSVLVTVSPPPIISTIVNGPVSFCVGDSTQLLAVGTLGTYEWFRFNSVVGYGQSYDAKSSGLYKCMVTDVYNCTSISNSVLISTPCLPPQDPIEKIEQSDQDYESFIHIYPNPGEGLFTVAVIGNTTIIHIGIYELSGKMIGDYDTPKLDNNRTMVINLNQLTSGTYLIFIKDKHLKLHRARIVKL